MMSENLCENLIQISSNHSSGWLAHGWKRNVLISRPASSFDIDELKNLKIFLTDITNSLLVVESRFQVDKEDLQIIVSLSQKFLVGVTAFFRSQVEPNVCLYPMIDLAAQLFRFLRNACAGCLDNQLVVNCCSESLLETLNEFIGLSLNNPVTANEGKSSEVDVFISKLNDILPLLRVAVQFTGNAVTGCQQNAVLVWRKLYISFRCLMACDDTSLKKYSSMLIFNCLDTEENVNDLIHSESGSQTVVLLIKHVMEEVCDTEWSLYILQKMIGREYFLQSVWNLLHDISREFLLETACQALQDKSEKSVSQVHVDNLKFISQEFIRQINETPEQVPCGLGVTLECLCSATSIIPEYSSLKDNKDLTLASIDLLRRLHQAMPPKSLAKKPVKSSDSSSKTSAVTSKNELQESDGDVNTPVGVKRRLVQLLANLTYQHRANQDCVREANGIPLILEQTQIDDNNPWIVQFAVLASRNLCDNNEENQRYIAAMRLEGLADNVDWLKEAGVSASLVGDKIIVDSCGQL